MANNLIITNSCQFLKIKAKKKSFTQKSHPFFSRYYIFLHKFKACCARDGLQLSLEEILRVLFVEHHLALNTKITTPNIKILLLY